MRVFAVVSAMTLAAPLALEAQSPARRCLTIERELSGLSDSLREVAIVFGEFDFADLGARAPDPDLSRAMIAADPLRANMNRSMIEFSEALDDIVAAARACAR